MFALLFQFTIDWSIAIWFVWTHKHGDIERKLKKNTNWSNHHFLSYLVTMSHLPNPTNVFQAQRHHKRLIKVIFLDRS